MMIAGDTHQRSPVLVVGFNHYLDFFPSIIADNLNAQHIFASDIMLDLISLGNRKFVTSMVLAHLFDTPEFRHEVINALKPKLGRVARVGFPAVLGLQHPTQVKQHLESSLGIPVFEIPGLPPSIPGIRLHNLLVSAIERNHGHIFNGMQVIGASSENKQITAIWSEAASRQKSHQSKTFVLATGGILGGGVVAKENGYAQDTVFGIQVAVPDQRTRWFVNEFLSSDSQPIHKTGLRVDQAFRPIDQTDQLFYDNLYAVGGALDGFDPIREHSLEGIALATGFSVGEILSNM
jgi:glycerol-3-phosphate dehydrogenase subunit B